MIIYRMCGKAEAFKGCGMIEIEPECRSALAPLKKRLNAESSALESAEIDHDLRLEKLQIKKLDAVVALELFTVQCPSVLVESCEVVHKKSYSRQAEMDFNDLPF